MGGTCRIVPRKAGSAASSASAGGSDAARVSTRPVMSSVSVVSPSRSSAR